MRASPSSDSATPSRATGVAASADASEAPTDSDVYVGLSRANSACDGRDSVTMFVVHDSGTSAHLVNDAALFIEGSQETCYVRVYGVNSHESFAFDSTYSR